MPQIHVFQCPSCGANLSYDGGPETNFPCQFCGTTVVVPPELRAAAVGSAASPAIITSETAVTPGIGADTASTQLAEAMRLALSGQQVEALKLLRESQGMDLPAARAALQQMLTTQSIDLGGAENAAPTIGDVVRGERAAEEEAVLRLARAGRTIEAVKLYRALHGVGLREAKDAVDAMAASPVPGAPAITPPAYTPSTAVPQARAARRAGRAVGCGGTIGGLLLTAAILGFVVAMMYLPFRMSGSYQQALDAARSDPAVIKAMGAPIQVSWWPGTGKISCGGGCSANYNIPIHGSHKSGHIVVMSDSKGGSFPFNDGTWTLDATVYVDGGPSFDLTPLPSPTPTLSSAEVDATQGAISQATQGAVSQATQEAQAASDAGATATAVVADQGTASAQANQDTLATAVADAQSSLPTMEAAQAAWPLVTKVSATDPFRGWPAGLRQDNYLAVTTAIKGTKYVWSVTPKQDGSYTNMVPTGGPKVTDFYAKADLQFLQGGPGNTYAFGLVFCRQGDDYGFFGLENDGSFRALEVHNTSISQQLEDHSAAILTKPSDVNHLLVRSQDSNFIFIVNGSVVGEMSATLSAGEMGLGVDIAKKGQPAQVQFSNFEVHAPTP
jgi:hypothetical protein